MESRTSFLNVPVPFQHQGQKYFNQHNKQGRKPFSFRDDNIITINPLNATMKNEEQNNKTMLPPSLQLMEPKQPKLKTRRTANKHGDKNPFSKEQKASTLKESLTCPAEDDQERKDTLSYIQQMRLANSVTKLKIHSAYKKAAKFVNGDIHKDGNKITITWLRGTKRRNVKFELVHKQKNEKASVFKGHKLKMVLDALEQIYLDGWDKESILSHLNGRFHLNNLPYEYLKVLWTFRNED